MTRYLSVEDVYEIHQHVIRESDGSSGVRDEAGVQSAIAQPSMTFDGNDFYETLAEKAAALCFSLVKNHAFIDGNKRVGHAAMETFLVMNGHELECDVDEQEQIILALAASEIGRVEFTEWVQVHVVRR